MLSSRQRYNASQITTLHDLVLREATSVLSSFHNVAVVYVGVLDVGQAQRSATVLVSSELG